MDEAPELAVDGYMGVGKLTLSKQLLHAHNNPTSTTTSSSTGDDRYKAMIKEGHAIADEYDSALHSARKDAQTHERAVDAHDLDPSSEELLEYRISTFRYVCTYVYVFDKLEILIYIHK